MKGPLEPFVTEAGRAPRSTAPEDHHRVLDGVFWIAAAAPYTVIYWRLVIGLRQFRRRRGGETLSVPPSAIRRVR
ncbi:hypothetical protein [Methylocystis iwaonis]|uniref:hypothetical protein n=1 Tax=Methylocystis iwaonis TaxID=2885079 RepID=UPI002E7B9665|nr:hypothetical protein [Methylocystis iwaonis]